MNTHIQELSRFGLNSRPLGEKDFYAVCADQGIAVVEADTSFYLVADGIQPVIAIDRRLRGLKRLFAMFHELGHHFAHTGDDAPVALFHGLVSTREEAEADAIALMALIPLAALGSHDFLEENPTKYAKKLYDEREKLYFLYGV
jgi:Zn-dependent peptidase ImmA (M78 family)